MVASPPLRRHVISQKMPISHYIAALKSKSRPDTEVSRNVWKWLFLIGPMASPLAGTGSDSMLFDSWACRQPEYMSRKVMKAVRPSTKGYERGKVFWSKLLNYNGLALVWVIRFDSKMVIG